MKRELMANHHRFRSIGMCVVLADNKRVKFSVLTKFNNGGVKACSFCIPLRRETAGVPRDTRARHVHSAGIVEFMKARCL